MQGLKERICTKHLAQYLAQSRASVDSVIIITLVSFSSDLFHISDDSCSGFFLGDSRIRWNSLHSNDAPSLSETLTCVSHGVFSHFKARILTYMAFSKNISKYILPFVWNTLSICSSLSTHPSSLCWDVTFSNKPSLSSTPIVLKCLFPMSS